jgi:hypothetical protein
MLALLPALYLMTLTLFSMFTCWYWLTKIIYPVPAVMPYYVCTHVRGRVGPVVLLWRSGQYLYR